MKEYYREGGYLIEDDGSCSELFSIPDASDLYHKARLIDKFKIKNELCTIPTCYEKWTYNSRCEKHQKKGISLGELFGKAEEKSGPPDPATTS